MEDVVSQSDVEGGQNIYVEDPPRTAHRFIARTGCVLGPKHEGFDIFFFVISIFLFAFTITAAVGLPFLADELLELIIIQELWILFGLAAFLATGLTEPGIVPPASTHSGYREEFENMDQEDKKGLKTCDICHITVPFSTRHCSWCNACCRELDHHCPITGTCIGARNKSHFVAMNFFAASAFWYEIFVGAIWLTLFWVEGRPRTTIVFAVQIISYLMLVHLIFQIAIWVALYFGWWDTDNLSPLPNPFFCFFSKCLHQPDKRQNFNIWKTNIDRKPLCCAHSKAFTVPERLYYRP
mmetsp:Transcript_20328/g.24675  ORF Transcript_20328/g.24675 Transcript_20328/m.24675 type:complete len:296 (-) Transcript_20328:517-1404(-)